MSFDMSKIYQIIDIIGEIVAKIEASLKKLQMQEVWTYLLTTSQSNVISDEIMSRFVKTYQNKILIINLRIFVQKLEKFCVEGNL